MSFNGCPKYLPWVPSSISETITKVMFLDKSCSRRRNTTIPLTCGDDSNNTTLYFLAAPNSPRMQVAGQSVRRSLWKSNFYKSSRVTQQLKIKNKTQKIKFWEDSKTQNYGKTRRPKLWQNLKIVQLKPRIVIKLKIWRRKNS